MRKTRHGSSLMKPVAGLLMSGYYRGSRKFKIINAPSESPAHAGSAWDGSGGVVEWWGDPPSPCGRGAINGIPGPNTPTLQNSVELQSVRIAHFREDFPISARESVLVCGQFPAIAFTLLRLDPRKRTELGSFLAGIKVLKTSIISSLSTTYDIFQFGFVSQKCLLFTRRSSPAEPRRARSSKRILTG